MNEVTVASAVFRTVAVPCSGGTAISPSPIGPPRIELAISHGAPLRATVILVCALAGADEARIRGHDAVVLGQYLPGARGQRDQCQTAQADAVHASPSGPFDWRHYEPFVSAEGKVRDSLRQHARSRRQLRRVGILRRVVADALAARNEDHPGRAHRHDELRIVERTRRQTHVPAALFGGGTLHRIDHQRREFHRQRVECLLHRHAGVADRGLHHAGDRIAARQQHRPCRDGGNRW